MKKILIAVLLLGLAVTAYAVSGRESKQLPPQQIELMYSSETWAQQVLDTSDTVRWQIGSDGTPDVYNSSGTNVWGIDSEGKSVKAVTPPDPVAATFTTGTGFVVTAADGNVWRVDTSLDTASNSSGKYSTQVLPTTGTTVVLPYPITTAMDGQEMTFIKVDSAATDMVLWAGGTSTSGVSIGNTSGITNSAHVTDALGDNITLIPSYTDQIYYIKSSYVQ